MKKGLSLSDNPFYFYFFTTGGVVVNSAGFTSSSFTATSGPGVTAGVFTVVEFLYSPETAICLKSPIVNFEKSGILFQM